MKMLEKTAILALGAGVLIASASAQELRTASENVVACQSVEDSAARLECFETAAAALSAALTLAEPTPVAAATVSPTVPAVPIETAVETAATSEIAPAAVSDAPAVAAVQQAAATETDTDTPNIPSSRLPSWIPRISFGSDRDVEKEPDEYVTQITRIQVNRIGRHFFTTSEGHVWKQKKIEDIRAPKSLPAEAILSQNITGGIMIKIKETNRSYRVDRIE